MVPTSFVKNFALKIVAEFFMASFYLICIISLFSAEYELPTSDRTCQDRMHPEFYDILENVDLFLEFDLLSFKKSRICKLFI